MKYWHECFLGRVIQIQRGDEVGCFHGLTKEVLAECSFELFLQARRELTNDGERALEELDAVGEADTFRVRMVMPATGLPPWTASHSR